MKGFWSEAMVSVSAVSCGWTRVDNVTNYTVPEQFKK